MSDSHTMPSPMGSKSTNKVSGVVKFYSVQKCYGFIKRDDTNEFVFVHSKSITGKNQRRVTRSLAKGEHVEFDVMMSDRSPEAINVTGINGGPVVGSEYGLISMQWHQYNAYKGELLRNGEHGMRDQSPRTRRFFHRRRNNATNHQSGNRERNQHQHHNQKAAANNQQRSANEQMQNQNDNLDENKPKTRRRRYNRNRRTRRRTNDGNDGKQDQETADKQDQETGVLQMTESNITTLLSELNIDNRNAISANSTSSESLDFEKIHNDKSNPIPCITSMPTASASSRLAATFSKGNQ